MNEESIGNIVNGFSYLAYKSQLNFNFPVVVDLPISDRALPEAKVLIKLETANCIK